VFVALPKSVVELLNFVFITIGAYVMSEITNAQIILWVPSNQMMELI
jgi:hypothetical protein